MPFKFKKTASNAPNRRRERLDDASDEPSTPFLRGRTLTGSSSQRIRSINEPGAQLKSPRTHVHHLANQRKRVIVLLAMALTGILLLYILVSQFTAQVRVVLHDFPNRDAQTTYEQTIQSYFDRHPIERLRFFANTSAMADYVQLVNPEVDGLTIEPSSQFATSTVRLVVREPVAGWMADGHQEYVDDDGIAFRRNYYAPPKLQIVDKSGLPIAAGKAIASDAFLGFVGRLVGALDSQGYTVTKVAIPGEATRQVNVSLKGSPFYIKCLVDRSAGEQAEDINHVVRYLDRRSISPDYIDVRIEGKAYFK